MRRAFMACRSSVWFAVGALLGCVHPDGSTPQANLPRVVRADRVEWGPAWGPAYVIRYETAREVWKIPPLRQEAESVWASLRPSVEELGVCTVQLRASEPQRELPFLGTKVVLTAGRNWDFLLFRDTTGQWKWLSSVTPPDKPCMPK